VKQIGDTAMKNANLIAAMMLLFSITMSSQASMIPSSISFQSSTIQDVYIGGDNHGYGDVIGSVDDFQINNMYVEVFDTVLRVIIDTTFGGKGDDGLFSQYTYGNTGIGYGDLFLSNSWVAQGDAGDNYINDDADTGTVWSHGYSLDNRYLEEGQAGTGVLYSLNGQDNQSNIKMSDEFLSSGFFRNNQEVAVDRDSTTTTALDNAGGWGSYNNLVMFEIDLAGTGLLDGSELALRWEFTCANDVIEGRHQLSAVPVPAAVWLFASGLLGLIAVGRRKI